MQQQSCKRSLAAESPVAPKDALTQSCKRSLAYRDVGKGREHMSRDGRY